MRTAGITAAWIVASSFTAQAQSPSHREFVPTQEDAFTIECSLNTSQLSLSVADKKVTEEVEKFAYGLKTGTPPRFFITSLTATARNTNQPSKAPDLEDINSVTMQEFVPGKMNVVGSIKKGDGYGAFAYTELADGTQIPDQPGKVLGINNLAEFSEIVAELIFEGQKIAPTMCDQLKKSQPKLEPGKSLSSWIRPDASEIKIFYEKFNRLYTFRAAP